MMSNFYEFCRTCGLDRFDGRFDMMDRFNRTGFLGPGGWLIGLLVVILLIVGIIFLIRAIVRSSRRPSGPGPVSSPYDQSSTSFIAGHSGFAAPSSAMRILDERFARGEIDSETYRKMKDELFHL